jgi:hypothetical protein
MRPQFVDIQPRSHGKKDPQKEKKRDRRHGTFGCMSGRTFTEDSNKSPEELVQRVNPLSSFASIFFRYQSWCRGRKRKKAM